MSSGGAASTLTPGASDLVQTIIDNARQGYRPINPNELIVNGADRTVIDGVLGLGSTQSSGSLVAAVRRLVHVSIGGITVEFTPGQVDELKHRAQKRNMTPEQYLNNLVQRFTQDLWTL